MARPHAVMVPCPTPGHINPMLKLAKLLHLRGFYITFVVTEYNHHCLLRSGAPEYPLGWGLDDFRFEVVSDGLPTSSGREGMQHIKDLSVSLRDNFPAQFRDLMAKLKRSPAAPPVTCVVDALISSALRVADELGIPKLLFWTTSACGFMGTLHFGELVERGYVPLTSSSSTTVVDWIPGMRRIRLRDISCFIRTTDPDDILLHFEKNEAECGLGAWRVILYTFDELEDGIVTALRQMLPRLYTLGSLSLLANQIEQSPSKSIHLSLWKEDAECLAWLDGREAGSVVYVNGSITVLTPQQLVEFAMGLAGSRRPFLWIIRPGLVAGESAVLPEAFVEQTRGRSFLTSWCRQEEVLAHPSVGGFLTHGGWNSMLESICGGVPMICWPFFAEQPLNCRYACEEWGVGMEIEGDVERGQVEALVGELMGGEKGKETRKIAVEWRKRAEEAAMEGGSSHKNMERLVHDILRETPVLVPEASVRLLE